MTRPLHDQAPLVTVEGRPGASPTIRCHRCHRVLHDPESRLLRLGPECRDRTERVRRCDVEQETLPGT